MNNIKKLIFPITLVMALIVIGVAKNADIVKPLANKANTVNLLANKANTVKPGSTHTVTIKDRKVYNGIDNVMKNASNKVKLPKNIDDLKLVRASLDHHIYGNAPIDVVILMYTGDNKELLIQEVNTKEAPKTISNTVKKVKLADGTEANVVGSVDNSKGFIQVIFPKGNMYYTVAGNLGLERLTKISNELE
jgi:hypothetical protein